MGIPFARRWIPVLLVLLGGCGFQPVYRDGGAETGAARPLLVDLAYIDIAVIADREGQILRNLLLDRLQPRGSAAQTDYTLRTRLNISTSDLGVQLDETTERSRVDVSASYTLSGDGFRKDFRSRSASSFSTLDVEYASLVAERDAIERSLRAIADEMTVKISAYLKRRAREN